MNPLIEAIAQMIVYAVLLISGMKINEEHRRQPPRYWYGETEKIKIYNKQLVDSLYSDTVRWPHNYDHVISGDSL